jgi:hypothetical protein
MKVKRVFPLMLMAMGLSLLCLSCDKNEEEGTLPELPPVEALQMPLDDFIGNPSENENLKSGYTYTNALYSYGTVSVWNLLVSVPMVVPVAAYLEALNHTPVYLGENSWEWSYALTQGEDAYSARLVTTRISNEEFTAEMFITRAGFFEDFKWFDGTIRYDRTHADWTLYEGPESQVAWLNIEWNMDWELEVSDITYEIVKADADEYGSSITYGVTEDDDYDAFYNISFSQKETFIKWNRTTKEGTVKDESFFGDADWHPWNSLFHDVVIPG